MSSEPKAVTRYDVDQYGMDAYEHGYYVTYADHEQALSALRAEVEALWADAQRWKKFCAAFDDPCRRQALARMFGLHTDAFEMPFNQILDAAMEQSA